ncbi:tRNA (adenosine(37)-N6)-threonylcarbamoyltransferase complex dimerization subunit type 1 TsaB [Calidifontibacter sp. DB0510]|uniref:tRNA (Adenosine(37)-N6)-threonylcarbamoyltransferase complex dimerization subunit type 1 TsaB n=1 Tax=Metallococcus carri TaxID=1656884 RepID=A0A967B6V4_9MICO|nr:tRNA (adenosine(37)-N6)-threonylcarbamoyltransferase complex dimerization subunit type 1 TsaB [Metallococcus carri]NHN56652.1 tRNA (adenosine(37)-N6)-threonylcarbamoyltransferase complex dimerization subunit type 1 TsaB [Metallococcus carri]NOP38951.1 tRNA (adenosine(37)-N6)-threonylcarbamoyltransferase complex dimerization subunit type 1 TsaB [Calidifontibacter sp. DB2511S]
MKLLALDTATTAVTVAVLDDDAVLADRTQLDARRHTEILAPCLDEAVRASGIARTDLEAIAVGVGPGPFTGLRVGIATALTLAHVLGIPAYGVCSLDAVAAQVDSPDFLVATDARRREVYWARYAGGARVTGPEVARPGDLPEELRELPTAGRGPELYPDLFPTPVDVLDASAAALGRLAARALATGEDLLPVRPLYLRAPDAQPSTGPKSVLPR